MLQTAHKINNKKGQKIEHSKYSLQRVQNRYDFPRPIFSQSTMYIYIYIRTIMRIFNQSYIFADHYNEKQMFPTLCFGLNNICSFYTPEVRACACVYLHSIHTNKIICYIRYTCFVE